MVQNSQPMGKKKEADNKKEEQYRMEKQTKWWKEMEKILFSISLLSYSSQYIWSGKKQSQLLVVVADNLMGIQRGKQVKVRTQQETQCPLFLNSSSNMSSPSLSLNQWGKTVQSWVEGPIELHQKSQIRTMKEGETKRNGWAEIWRKEKTKRGII